MIINRRICLVAIFVGLLTSLIPGVLAAPQLGRYLTGTLTHLDVGAKQPRMRRDDNGREISFTWKERTKFVQNSEFTEVSAFKKGDTVKVFYRNPHFGKAFVTSLKKISPASPKPQK